MKLLEQLEPLHPAPLLRALGRFLRLCSRSVASPASRWMDGRMNRLGPLTGSPAAEARSFTEREWKPDFTALHDATTGDIEPSFRIVK